MADLELYVLPIPSDDQTGGDASQQPQNSLQGLLGQDADVAERISSPPGTLRIQAQFRGLYSDLMAAELKELVKASGYKEIALQDTDRKAEIDGYYVGSEATVGPADQRERRIQTVDIRLKGGSNTAASHYRSVATNQRDLTTPFGSTSTAEVGVPAVASDVRWVNTETNKTESATVQTTRTTEFGDVDIYHQDDSTFTNPSLIYDVDYADEGDTDVRVWDDRGQSSREDGDGIPQWQKVFLSTHDYEGDAVVISNGKLRLTFDAANNNLSAEEYSSGSWSSKSLGASDWQLSYIDIGHRPDQDLGPLSVDALTRWEDTTQSPTATYELDMSLQRGHTDALFYRLPDSSNSVPSGLQTLLDPIASSYDLDAQPTRTIRPRTKVTEDG